jgi:two-component system alkaline phosphatase synthesis response regulator PhoP/two-component system response regulator VicR
MARFKPWKPPRLVLVVDDEWRMVYHTAAPLEPAGYRVSSARTGPQALAKARIEAPDAVVLDAAMPEMDGFETLRRLREQAADLPVVLLLERKGAGAERNPQPLPPEAVYLLKPIIDRELLQALERLIPAREAADPGGAAGRARVHAELYRTSGLFRPAVVLVADDEPHVVRLVEVNLQRAGYRVVSTGDAARVAALAAEENPALVILDLMMPDARSGYRALAELEAHPTTCGTPVILLTGGGPLEPFSCNVLRLQKPFNPMELLYIIQRTLGGKGSYTPHNRLE